MGMKELIMACFIRSGFLVCLCTLAVLTVTLISSSRHNKTLFDLINNRITYKHVNFVQSKFVDNSQNNPPYSTFQDEYRFEFPDPAVPSTNINEKQSRVKRNAFEPGVLRANHIDARNIQANKMHARQVTADIVKAEKVKAIVISIGRAFSVLKATSPTGAPDTLVLNRNGPDPTDSSVTIVLEREGHPISINGHPIHESEKNKLLHFKDSLKRKTTLKPKPNKKPVQIRKRNDKPIGKGKSFVRKRQSLKPRDYNESKTKSKIDMNKKRTAEALSKPKQLQSKTVLKSVTLGKQIAGKPILNRNKHVRNTQPTKRYGTPNHNTKRPTKMFVQSKYDKLTPSQKKKLIMNHWRKKMYLHNQRQALINKLQAESKINTQTTTYPRSQMATFVKSSVKQSDSIVRMPVKQNIAIKPLKQALVPIMKQKPFVTLPNQKASILTVSKTKFVLPTKPVVPVTTGTNSHYLEPIISKVKTALQTDTDKSGKSSDKPDYGDFSEKDIFSTEENEGGLFGVPMKAFEKTRPSFDVDTDEIFYDSDESDKYEFDDSVDKERPDNNRIKEISSDQNIKRRLSNSLLRVLGRNQRRNIEISSEDGSLSGDESESQIQRRYHVTPNNDGDSYSDSIYHDSTQSDESTVSKHLTDRKGSGKAPDFDESFEFEYSSEENFEDLSDLKFSKKSHIKTAATVLPSITNENRYRQDSEDSDEGSDYYYSYSDNSAESSDRHKHISKIKSIQITAKSSNNSISIHINSTTTDDNKDNDRLPYKSTTVNYNGNRRRSTQDSFLIFSDEDRSLQILNFDNRKYGASGKSKKATKFFSESVEDWFNNEDKSEISDSFYSTSDISSNTSKQKQQR